MDIVSEASGYISKSIDAGRMGKAVEHLVAAFCILATRGTLNVSTSLVDDEGVDLVFHQRGSTATLAVQVKARMSDSKRVQVEGFLADIRSQTFVPRADLALLFVAIDATQGRIMKAWLVPSEVFAEMKKPGGRGNIRFAASMKADSKDRWRPYRLEASELPTEILKRLKELERSTANQQGS